MKQATTAQTVDPSTPHNHRPPPSRLQAGFTMIELLIVIVILGVLAAIAAPLIADGQKMANATEMYDAADRIATNWRFVTTRCQVANTIGTTTPILTTPTASNILTMLVEGNTGAGAIAAAYTACYNSAKLEPINRSVIRNGAVANTYQVANSTITLANVIQDTVNRVAVTFANVDTDTALSIVNQHGSAGTANALTALSAAGDATDATIRYTAPALGVTSLTIIR